MAQKRKPSETPEPRTFERLGKSIDDMAGVQAAEELLANAKAEFEEARRRYHQIRSQAVKKMRTVREQNVGDLVTETLKTVKKYPGPGVLVAMCIGFLLGRAFRK